MNRKGPIIVIEDDQDDQEVFQEVFKDLGYKNEIIFFSDGEAALNYLQQNDVEPFILFSDINMPKLSGLELRNKVHENENLRIKTIPYLFFSTSAEQQHVVEAYSKSIQGFFIKPHGYAEIRDLMRSIIEYWQKCVSPNYTA
jgi:CheY-like chemotaxis protein